MITPILLCGGSGTRLWPLSRKSYPKQFASIMSESSLFATTAHRVNGGVFNPPVVVAASAFRFIVTQQLAAAGIDPATIMIEPEPRNTAPAILAAALHLAKQDPQALMLVVPSDHVLPDVAAFHAAVEAAAETARAGRIVTFGIEPGYAETGYGYLELADTVGGPSSGPCELKRFIEKPERSLAEAMLKEDRFLWNAGIFLFSAETMLAAFKTHAPELLPPVEAAVTEATPDLGFFRLAPEPWSHAPDVSIDYAIMEKATNLSVMRYEGAWSDLGGWAAVWRESPRDDAGNAVSAQATAINCTNSLLRSEDERLEVVGIGLDNVVVVAMPDAVLVANTDCGEQVREAVRRLKARGIAQAETFPKDHRPWGWFESLVIGDRFQVKRIVVNPGAALSLQSHHHRSEHWIVVAGTARVTVDDDVRILTENQSVYIPLGATHRMENPGKIPMVLVEVQTGSYLGEDDIIRYEDVYARS